MPILALLFLLVSGLPNFAVAESLSCPTSETLEKTISAVGIGWGSECVEDCKANLQTAIDSEIKAAEVVCKNSAVVDPITSRVTKIIPCAPTYAYLDSWSNPNQSDNEIPHENSYVCRCSKTIEITRACIEVPEPPKPAVPTYDILCKPKKSTKDIKFLGGTLSMSGATMQEVVARPDEIHSQEYCWSTPIVPPVFNWILGDRLPDGWEVGGGTLRDVRYNDRGGILPIAEQQWFGLCIKTPIGDCWFGMVELDN
jgi:hypothetical protein